MQPPDTLALFRQMTFTANLKASRRAQHAALPDRLLVGAARVMMGDAVLAALDFTHVVPALVDKSIVASSEYTLPPGVASNQVLAAVGLDVLALHASRGAYVRNATPEEAQARRTAAISRRSLVAVFDRLFDDRCVVCRDAEAPLTANQRHTAMAALVGATTLFGDADAADWLCAEIRLQ